MSINMLTLVGTYEGMNWQDLLLDIGGKQDSKIIPIRLTGNLDEQIREHCEPGKVVGVKGKVDTEIGTGVIIVAERISIIK